MYRGNLLVKMRYCIIKIIIENVEHRISIIELSSSLTYTIILIEYRQRM